MSSVLLGGNIEKTLRATATPMVIALFAVGSTGIVDAYFVGRLGTTALAGFGFCIPLFYLAASIWIGFGIGVTSTIARYIGAGELVRARRVGVDALLLALALLALLIPAFIFLKSALFAAFGVPAHLQPAASRFVDIMALGMPVLAFVTVASAILRGHGAIKASSAVMVVASLGNIALDPMLILGSGHLPGHGLGGAALASSGGYTVAAFASIAMLTKKRALSLKDGGTRFAARARAVVAVSLPAIIAQLVRPFALLGLTVLVSSFGEAAVAAFATGANVERVVVNVFLGLASALTPFVGQNWGAQQHARASAGVRMTAVWALAIGAAAWLVCAVLSSFIARAFVVEVDARAIFRELLWVLPLGYGVAGVTLLSVSALNAMGRGSSALALTLIEQVVLVLPLAAIGSQVGGLNGLLAGIVCARLLASLEARRRLGKFGIGSDDKNCSGIATQTI